ncbi:cytochrome c [Herbaspirillum huttiense F1]|uniref:c-type cytochrome n=1 Tax=Herbaspirillum TaxID=963 RepID=UPI001AE51EAE|nr:MULTISPECIES: cytochrome c [Herbaspirillum]MBP1313485.1 cytochrome c [Herbaspirillum sp. 1130]MDT0355244.1 cytochrome c [Herbaspirillum huttiense F1]
MCRSERAWLVLALLMAMASSSSAAERLALGQPLSDAQLARWNIDVDAQGRGLPAGRGSVAQGQRIYAQTCAACHGDKGQGNPADALVGGQGSLATAKPLKTIGSFWPYATTVFDFINRAMPYNAPKSLSADEVYAVTAYLLHLNGIVPANTVLDAASLPQVRMPNRDGFIGDTRPDTSNVACQHCPPPAAASTQ